MVDMMNRKIYYRFLVGWAIIGILLVVVPLVAAAQGRQLSWFLPEPVLIAIWLGGVFSSLRLIEYEIGQRRIAGALAGGFAALFMAFFIYTFLIFCD